MNLRNYAYLGDAVWELFIRERTIYLTNNSKKLHNITTNLVNTHFQYKLIQKMENILSPEELEIVRRARNLPIPVGRRSIQYEYRYATAFEALIGYWFLKDKSKYKKMLKYFEEEVKSSM